MHKPKLKHLLLAVSLSLGVQSADAASLGAMTVLSAIGQPFSAEIEITPASEQELAALSAKIASPEAFAAQGITVAPEVASLHVEVTQRPDGKPILVLTSVEPVSTPAMDLLIEVDTEQGEVLRKYSVALEAAPAEDAPADVALPDLTAPVPENLEPEITPEDNAAVPEELPEFTDEMAELEGLPGLEEEQPYTEMTPEEIEADRQAVEEEPAEDLGPLDAPVPEEEMAAEDQEQPVEAAAEPEQEPMQQVAPAQEPVTAPAATSMADYTVERGDTLRNIAVQKGVDGASLEQMMAALYRANPHAFEKGNINRLKTGEILHSPSPEEIKAIDQADAEREVRMHAKNWNSYRNKLASTVAKSAPAKDDQPASQVASGNIDTVKDQAAATGPRDVVKLSGGDTDKSGKANKGSPSKAELQEELVAREKALQESNERILMLEKQLKDAQKLIELRKPTVGDTGKMDKPGATPEQAKPAAAGQMGISTLQEQLQKHPNWAPLGGAIAAILAVLVLLVRNSRRKKKPELAPEPSFSESGVDTPVVVAPTVEDALVAPVVAEAPVTEEPAKEEYAMEPASDVLAETMDAFTAPQEVPPEATAAAVLDFDDIAALMPEPAPEPEPLPEPVAEPEPVVDATPAAPAMAEETPVEELPQDVAALAAMFDVPATEPAPVMPVEAPTMAETPKADETDAFAMDDVFSDQAALAELVAATPAAAAPVDEVAAAMADEAATDMMAMEQGVQAEDPFDMDDVFSGATQEEVAKPVETVAEADPFAMDDVFTSEAALADLVAEAPLTPAEPEDAMAAAMADEAATDMMAMAAGETEAEDQFALDDVFGDTATMTETVAEPKEDLAALLADTPEAKPEPDAKSDDHTAALSAAFDESATADLADLDFGFDIDLGDTAAAPKAPAKVAEKVPALDFSNINLDVGGNAAATAAESTSAEPPEVDTKLDLVTAYIDMSDNDGARELLQEVLKEGGPNQVAKAQKMLDSLG